MQISKVELVKQVEVTGLRSGSDHHTQFVAGKREGTEVTIEPHALGVRVVVKLNDRTEARVIPSSNIAAIHELADDTKPRAKAKTTA